MKALLLHNWQIKSLFLVIWLLMAGFADRDRVTDFTHNPTPSWFFFCTLPAFVICLAWAGQSEILREGLSGTAKYAKWALVVVVDIALFTLCLLVIAVVVALLGGFNGDDYTRRAYNSELLLNASTLRSAITTAAEKSGSIVGAGKGLSPPGPSKLIDFGYVNDDGVIVLHSHKTESTAFLIPRMGNAKVIWDCRGFPQSAFPGSCRGSYLQDIAALSAESLEARHTCPDPEKK